MIRVQRVGNVCVRARTATMALYGYSFFCVQFNELIEKVDIINNTVAWLIMVALFIQVVTAHSSDFWTHSYILLCIRTTCSQHLARNSIGTCGGRNISLPFKWWVLLLLLLLFSSGISFKQLNSLGILSISIEWNCSFYPKIYNWSLFELSNRFNSFLLWYMHSNCYSLTATIPEHLSGGSACTRSCSSSYSTNSTNPHTNLKWWKIDLPSRRDWKIWNGKL